MITKLTKQDLVDFEQDVLTCFEDKQIRAPIHLSGGDETVLMSIFQNVRRQDWVCSTWRSHYHCLLKGVPPQEVKRKILNGHSISLCFKEQKVVSSAIVGGITPVALGLAWAAKEDAKESKSDEHVWCFIGDMSATTGVFWESYNYSVNFDLPITWVVANNDTSVCTPTSKVWQYTNHPMSGPKDKIIHYHYQPKFPHTGGKTRVNF